MLWGALRRGWWSAIAIIVVAWPAAAHARSSPPRGALTRLAGQGGCLGAERGCGALRGISDPFDIAASPAPTT